MGLGFRDIGLPIGCLCPGRGSIGVAGKLEFVRQSVYNMCMSTASSNNIESTDINFRKLFLGLRIEGLEFAIFGLDLRSKVWSLECRFLGFRV